MLFQKTIKKKKSESVWRWRKNWLPGWWSTIPQNPTLVTVPWVLL